MTRQVLDKFRRILNEEKAGLRSMPGVRLDALAGQGRVAEEDQASISHEEFISLHVNSLDWEKLIEVDEALRRIDDGNYGLCEECGEAISPRRLEAIPWARLCVSCQEKSGQPEEEEAEP